VPRIVKDWLADHVELPAGLTAAQLAEALVKVGLEEEEIHPAAVTGPLVVGRVLLGGSKVQVSLTRTGSELTSAVPCGRHPR
jgi:hypothetical protein